jgi:hypothetical protein
MLGQLTLLGVVQMNYFKHDLVKLLQGYITKSNVVQLLLRLTQQMSQRLSKIHITTMDT